MNIRIQDQGQSLDSAANLNSASTQAASSSTHSANSTLTAINATEDTTSISAAPGQLSGDLALRQDRVDALRAQVEAGTYTVNAHAVASAMFQNLFRS